MTMAGMRRILAVLCAASALLYAAGCGADLRIDVQKDEEAANLPPVAYAGMDQSVLVGTLVTLDGSGSTDPDRDLISYSWTLLTAPVGSLAVLAGPATVYPTFTADIAGTYSFLLTVSDGEDTSVDYVNVTAAVPNAAPVANAGPDQTVVIGNSVNLDGTGSSDADGDSLNYTWSFVSVPAGSTAFLFGSTLANPNFLADVSGQYIIQLVVSDGYASSAADFVTINAGAQAAPTANAGVDQSVAAGTLVTLDGSGSFDPNAEPLTYSWFFVSYPAGETPVLNGTTLVNPTFTANIAGDYVIGLIVNDGTSNSTQDNVVVTAAGGTLFYRDADTDTYGNPAVSVQAAVAPSGYVTDNTDCDDTNAAINPAAAEVCDAVDNNCVSSDDLILATYFLDNDGDGYGLTGSSQQSCSTVAGYSLLGGDCNDANIAINPAAAETCNGVDDNCVNGIDEGVTTTYYPDVDGDTFGGDAGAVQACSNPGGWLLTGGDCNDNNFDIKPGVIEVCDAVDNNCNPADDLIWTPWYQDFDSDGYGNTAVSQNACTQPTGYVTDRTDCNDTVPSIHPGAAETCNGLDDDCDMAVDEGVKTTFYADTDGDTYGDAASTIQACTAPAGYVANSTDCNDAVNTVHPGAPEICDAYDNDCVVGGAQILATYYQDLDGDLFGNLGSTQDACSQPAGFVNNSADCDDANAAVNPSAAEVCNGIDDNCLNGIDEGVTTAYYPDVDGDNYGNKYAAPTQACTQPFGYVTDHTDCNDLFPAVNPGMLYEVCSNMLDDNCNGITDAEPCIP